jgi:hypothetical protein
VGTRNQVLVRGAAVFGAAILLAGCGQEKKLNRDYIPQLRTQFNNLQIAVKDRDQAAIDSLFSVQTIGNRQVSDSLLSFVYGPGDDFAFDRFGDAEIFYTESKARIDAYVMDSTSNKNRPVTFTLVHEHGAWLLKRFGPRTDTVKTISGP